MTNETAALPDDVEQLKQLVIAQRAELEHLKLVIAKLRRLQFGRSSEKLDRQIAQRELQLEELQISQDKIFATLPAARQPEPTPPKRQPLPEAKANCYKRDRYGRFVCTVYVDGQDVGLAQLDAGMAWWFRQYAHEQPPRQRIDYQSAEDRAAVDRVGLWQDANPIPPWEFRATRGRRE